MDWRFLLAALGYLWASSGVVAEDSSRTFEGPYRLRRSSGNKLKIVLDGKMVTPHLEASEWIVYAPVAPDHLLQDVKRCTLEVTSGSWKDPARSSAKTAREESSHRRFVKLCRYKPRRGRDRLAYRQIFEVETYRVELERGQPRNKVRSLSRAERQAYQAATEIYDFRSREFKDWLGKNSLFRKEAQRDLHFAYVALQTIAKRFRYAYPPRFTERKCTQVIQEGASDCGGLSFLFVSVLRANGIPARSLVGRWTVPGREGDEQHHVKAEFYAEGVGWVPVDASGAVTWASGVDGAFGKERGQFLIFHVDEGLILDTFYWGKKTVHWAQGPLLWAAGTGSFDGSSNKSAWQVATLSR